MQVGWHIADACLISSRIWLRYRRAWVFLKTKLFLRALAFCTHVNGITGHWTQWRYSEFSVCMNRQENTFLFARPLLFDIRICASSDNGPGYILLAIWNLWWLSERYCSRKRARISPYFDWQDSQSTFSWILFTLYFGVTMRSNSTSVSVHTYDSPRPPKGAISVAVPFPLMTSGFWFASVVLL